MGANVGRIEYRSGQARNASMCGGVPLRLAALVVGLHVDDRALATL